MVEPQVVSAAQLHGWQWPLAVGDGNLPEMCGHNAHGLAFMATNSSLQEMENRWTHHHVVCLFVLAYSRGFNKRVASHQAATCCKSRYSNGKRYSGPLVAL